MLIFSQFISVLWLIGLLGGHEGWFSRDPLPDFSAGDPCEQFRHGQGCTVFDAFHPAFPLLTLVSPTLQGALKKGFGGAVLACDMPEPCKFPSLYSCQKRFLWTHKEVDLAPQPSGWSYAPSRRWVEIPQMLDFNSLGLYFSQQTGSFFTAIEEDGGGKRLVELDFDGFAPPDSL